MLPFGNKWRPGIQGGVDDGGIKLLIYERQF